MRLREEQDAAYGVALEADQAKKRQKLAGRGSAFRERSCCEAMQRGRRSSGERDQSEKLGDKRMFHIHI
ncbi:hypothetical protein Bca4012_080255 [Brassica carinata]|uniref:Uncharacterized protein n=2 Tax=Brassica TaxID=3705 RepID=A0ABQ7YS88_BRANA|nr:hypothetical protein HID58_078107 [Brassica napus]VDD40270.1 unnamed protein product [Brassica oleracea]